MRILYLVIILFLVNFEIVAQDRLDNWQWAEWEQTAKHLDEGDFNSAMAICKLHPRNRGFAERLKQIQDLKQLNSEGEQQQKAGRYFEAIATYKKHRTSSGVGSLTYFEKKIDQCVAKVAMSNLSRLKILQRQVFASELAVRALRELEDQNASSALKDFTQAQIVIGKTQGNLKILIDRGVTASKAFMIWDKKYQIAKNNNVSLEGEQDLLVELGYIPLVKIPSLNRRLATVIEEIAGKNSIEEALSSCELDRLIETLSASSEIVSSQILDRRNVFKSTYSKLQVLNGDRKHDSTITSGYRSLYVLMAAFPKEIQLGLKRCLDDGRIAALKAFLAQAIAEGDTRAATSYRKTLLEEMGIQENVQEDCVDVAAFNSNISKVRDALLKCNLSEAQQLWNELEKAADCNDKRLKLQANTDLGKRITQLIAADRQYNRLLNEARDEIKRGNFKNAKAKYLQLSKTDVCDLSKRDTDLKVALDQLSELEGKYKITLELVGGVGGNKPLYKVNSESRPMNYGITFGAGIQVAYVNPANSAALVFGIEYISTSYYSADKSSYSLEKFTVNGLSGSLSIKMSPFKEARIKPYMKAGVEGIVPLSNQYERYSSLGAIGNNAQLKHFLPSVLGALGVEFKVANVPIFLEVMGFTSVESVLDRNQKNILSPGNQEVDARFRRASIRLGVKLF
ncbi:hypothetical protein DYBT9623_04472 [Dyadobacter sp. CECT 9623]|uniref:Outer membrane protein beta-barrel domain-containing protein n=1 Tax=Dyadobacter linearis TaxID=2823330 RepID=A0ABN7RGT3_9BACT|nr:hypothetical protein [Dyadobacter sp. CECT 9623]CAG5072936.1 hypothetical protein DYBT9623_04472 [Dyadobacter sp. CECT 9623]